MDPIQGHSLADILGAIEPRLSLEEVEQIIRTVGVREANPGREELAHDLYLLGMLLDNMHRVQRPYGRENAKAISAAARKLHNFVESKLVALFSADELQEFLESRKDVIRVTKELIRRSDLVLKETDKNPPAPKPITSLEEWLSRARLRLSRDEIIADLMTEVFERHFKPQKVGFSGGKVPGGAFVRFVQTSVRVLAPSKINRFSPNMIREAVRRAKDFTKPAPASPSSKRSSPEKKKRGTKRTRASGVGK